MSTITPKPRALQRPSYGGLGTSNSPNFARSTATRDHIKDSYNALVGPEPEFNLGDQVNVPGDMSGTVRFIGTVHGKPGNFLGVELFEEYAPRGKNDGSVDGIHYFDTEIPGSGIFLPVHRAEMRQSAPPDLSPAPNGSNTPAQAKIQPPKSRPSAASTTIRSSFSQSMGPGARPPSPSKPTSRNSLARPASPLRREPAPPTPARHFSRNLNLRASIAPPASPAVRSSATPIKKATATPRPYSRTGSRLGHRDSDAFDGRASIRGPVARPSQTQSSRSPSRLASHDDNDRITQLQTQLRSKDAQLQEQATTLSEMESSLKELQIIMDNDAHDAAGGHSAEARQLLASIQEKDEKIRSLLSEFDIHRADFRSTIEALEAGVHETERVYADNISKHEAEIRALKDSQSQKDDFESMESIATQLKSLEELVAELEEGLEDARRGEAEARSELEHLRGEVERHQSQADRAQTAGSPKQDSDDKAEIARLTALVEKLMTEATDARKSYPNGLHSADGTHSPLQASPDAQVDDAARDATSTEPYCENCEKHGHDLLSCENVDAHTDARVDASRDTDAKTSTKPVVPDADKWCAMCEKDGHLAFECPEESY